LSIPLLFPEIYHKQLESGVTKPSLLTCKDKDGNRKGEYVVKLRANISFGVTSLAFELIASNIALCLDIPTPEAVLIEIDENFASSIKEEEISKSFISSLGLNFGNKYLKGYSTWTRGMSLSSFQSQLACEIFAFDALIQNPDRSLVHNKPNVLTKNEEIIIIDHEKAFSFLFPLIGKRKMNAWEISEETFVKNHLFYSELKKSSKRDIIDFDYIKNKIERLSTNKLDSIIDSLPTEWKNDYTSKIRIHLEEIVNYSDKFIYELKKTLL